MCVSQRLLVLVNYVDRQEMNCTNLNLFDRDLVISTDKRVPAESRYISIDVPGEGVVVIDEESVSHFERASSKALLACRPWVDSEICGHSNRLT